MRASIFFVFTILYVLFYGQEAMAQYNAVLTKGVRMAFTRYIQTNSINAQFNKNGISDPLSFNFDASANSLINVDNQEIQSALQDLKMNYPDAFDSLSLGAYKFDAKADMKINAYGMSYGFTNRLTGYFGVPFYDARINLDYTRTKGNTYQDVNEILNSYGGDTAGIFANVADIMFDVGAPTIQNLLVSEYGYAPLGQWSGQGPGDTEFGLMYTFEKDRLGGGTMITVGGIAPTGYVDDPDVLQDQGFGDGQWDAFVEYGGSYFFTYNFLLSAWARYTHQFGTTKELRIVEEEGDILSDRKGMFYEKLGNQFIFNIGPEWIANEWMTIYPQYQFDYQEATSYESEYTVANEVMAKDTDSYSHSFRFQLALSSVNLFLQEKFLLPLQLKLTYQTSFAGMNSPVYDRIEMDFRMFF
jgi:hypothetical protein